MEDAAQDPAGQQVQTDPQQAQGGSEGKDYKALYEEAVKESRKWEKCSKDNLAQLNGLKESRGKPNPTIEERIAALEKENGDLKAASERAALVDSAAKATEWSLSETRRLICEVSLTSQLSGTIVKAQTGL